MSFKNTFISHDRSPEVTAWIEEERVEQEERFRAAVPHRPSRTFPS